MNRIRRKIPNQNEIQIQLGEPLPLPYKVNKFIEEIEEEEEDTAVETKHYNEPIIIKKRYNELRNESSRGSEPKEDMDRANRLASLNKPRPIPIRKDYKLRSLSNNNQKRTHNSNNEQLKWINSMESTLMNVKNLAIAKQCTLNIGSLQEIDRSLTDLLKEREQESEEELSEMQQESYPQHQPGLKQDYEEKPSNPSSMELIQELERLQRLNEKLNVQSGSYNIHSLSRFHLALIIISIIFLITSFLVSGLNYEYCYYFC